MARPVALLALIVLASACSDLSDYDGTWQGTVVGDARPEFLLSGFPPGTGLTIRDFAPSPGSAPGFLTTEGYDAFDDTPLEVIEPLKHDQLSQYDFPGQGRVQNYIYASRPTTGPIAGRDAMVFISLIDDDTLEARIIVGDGNPASGGHFGFWYLKR